MTKIVTIEQHYKFPREINEQRLRRLYDQIIKSLNSNNNDVSFTILYSDNSSIINATIEDVVNDENRKEREIKNLKIKGKNTDSDITINFKAFISLEISGPDRQNVFTIQSQIEDRLKTFKTSYPRAGIIVTVFVILYFIIFFIVRAIYFPAFLQTNSAGKVNLSELAIFLAIMLFCFILSRLILKLFPNSIFLIGDNIDRHNKLVRLRSNLFWVVGVGIILTIIGTIISKGGF